MKLKKIYLLISMVFLFVLCFLDLNVTAANVTKESEEVIYLTSESDELLGTGVHLPSKVRDNAKVKKIVLPKDAEYVLSDFRYEIDKSFVQKYESLTPNCPNLVEVEVHPENSKFTVRDGILYSKDLKVLYYCPPGKKGAVILPDEVEIIQYMAFQGCNQITSITFSSSLQRIYDGAFGENVKLSTLKITNDNPNFVVKSNVLFSKDGEVLYLYPAGKKNTYYHVPYGVRRIHPAAFMGNNNIITVNIPETVRSIGIEAFENCSSLTKVKLSEGLLEIEAGAFLNCKKLNGLNFPDGLLNVYEDVIKGCSSLRSITIPESIQQAPNVEKQGVTVKYVTPNEIQTSAMTKAPANAVKGTGKPDTTWYDSKKSTFTIKNPDQLAGLAKLVNQGKNMLGKTFILANNLDLSSYLNWKPIGMWTEKSSRIFKGTFDGKNNTIYNLRINLINSYEVGLFGTVQGEIKNLIIKDADVLGDSSVGILCGFAQKGTYSNCFVSGRVRGNEYVGGMIGRSSGEITYCSADVVVKGKLKAGGILGDGSAFISNCSSTGEIFSYDTAGGISGKHSGKVIDSTNTAMVEGNQNVGGIVGVLSSSGIIEDCINEGFITGMDYIGGVAGTYDFTGTIEKCINKGDVAGRYFIGGIAGSNSIGKCMNSNNYGTVTGFSMVGGVIGLKVDKYSEKEEILDCKNEGTILGIRYYGDITGTREK